MTDDVRSRLIERARGGDWDAIEDLVSGAVAPTFDAALHLLGDPSQAARAAEDALLDLLLAVRRGELTDGDPLTLTARSLAATARAASQSPFGTGLTQDDMVLIGRRPDDARSADIARVAASDRIAAVLLFALDLTPEELAPPLGRTVGEVTAGIARVLAAIPADLPDEAFRNILDARASQTRVPGDLEERVLDRYEKV